MIFNKSPPPLFAMKGAKQQFCYWKLVLEDNLPVYCIDHNGSVAVNMASDDVAAQRVEQQVLDGTLDRAGTELWVVACLGKQLDGTVGPLECDAVVAQHLLHAGQLQANNLCNLLLIEWREHDGLVDTI